jgi:hypothetical protein
MVTVAVGDELTRRLRLTQERQFERAEKGEPDGEAPQKGHDEALAAVEPAPVVSLSLVGGGHCVLFLSLIAVAQVGWVSGLSFLLYAFLR